LLRRLGHSTIERLKGKKLQIKMRIVENSEYLLASLAVTGSFSQVLMSFANLRIRLTRRHLKHRLPLFSRMDWFWLQSWTLPKLHLMWMALVMPSC